MNQIKKGAVISYITVAFNIISGIFFTPYLIHKVGNGDYGTYTLVSTFLNYFLVDFGLGNSVSKFLAECRAKKDKKRAGNIIAIIFKLFLMISLIIGVVLIIIYFFIEDFFTGLSRHEIIVFKNMYIISGFTSVCMMVFIPLDGILTAYEMFTEQKLTELIRKIAVILLSVVALSVSTRVELLVCVNSIVAVMIVLIKILLINGKIDLKINWKYWDTRELKSIGSFSIWLTVLMLAQRLIIPIAPTILGRYSNSEQISIFSVSTTVEGYVYTIAACLNGLFLPKLTQMTVNKQFENINYLFLRVGKIQTCIIGAIITTFVVFGKEFIQIWVGYDFLDAYYVILLLITPSIVVYSQEVANSILMIENKIKYKAFCYLGGAAISIIVSCLLSPQLGAIGAGMGVAICLWGSHVICMNVIYSKVTKLDVKNFFIYCYKKIIPCILLLTVAGILININFFTNNLLILSGKILIFLILYLIVIWFLGAEREDRLLVSNVVNNFIQKGR